MKNSIIIAIVVAVVVGAGSFYAGTALSKSRSGQSTGFVRGQMMNGRGFNGQPNGARGGMQGNGFVAGKIIAKDDQSITIESQGGGSKKIFFSTSTAVTKSTAGSPDDLSVGNSVIINGKASQDGSVSAQMIQIRPAQQ
jgi:hypothetical protein